MSAWIVSRVHIDVLVRGVIEEGGFYHRGKWFKVVEDEAARAESLEHLKSFYTEARREQEARRIMTATDLGKMLWSENHKSVNARYGERTRTPEYWYIEPKKYMTYTDEKYSRLEGNTWVEYIKREGHIDRGLLATQASCYDYQTCEHDTYYASRAFSVVLALGKSLLHKVEGSKEAPWGV